MTTDMYVGGSERAETRPDDCHFSEAVLEGSISHCGGSMKSCDCGSRMRFHCNRRMAGLLRKAGRGHGQSPGLGVRRPESIASSQTTTV
jgi:hypothetical protein